jgi:hypothetical protein
MELSREAKVVAAIILLAVPTVQYGGLFILGLLTHGVAGTGGAEAGLNTQQLALFRAGHAHAGVWLILSLVVQVLLDAAPRLPSSTQWLARIAAPVGTLALSGGMFGLAFKSDFRWLLYFGGTCHVRSARVDRRGLAAKSKAGRTNRDTSLASILWALEESTIKKLLLQVPAVAAYFALVVILYWRWLPDLGAVAIIVALLFFFKAVVDSGAISIDPKSTIRSPAIELFKTLSFFGVGAGAWVDLAKAIQTGLMPANVATAIIHITLVCIFAICVACCCARFSAALKNGPKS